MKTSSAGTGVHAIGLGVLLLLTSGCGDDVRASSDAGAVDSGTGAPEPTPRMDPDSGGFNEQTPEAGAPDAGGQFPDFFIDLRSNIPNIRVVQESEMGLSQLRMTSSNLQPLPGGGLRWFAEIRNGSYESWCNPDFVVRFIDGAGETLWQGDAEVRSSPHLAAGEVLACVAGEETVVAWAVDLEAPSIDLNQVDAIGLRFGGDAVSETTAHPATPQLEAAELFEAPLDSGVHYIVTGRLLGRGQLVAYAAVEVFAKNEQGFIFEVQRAPKLQPADGTLEPGEVWEFQTDPSPDPIASFRPWVSFEL